MHDVVRLKDYNQEQSNEKSNVSRYLTFKFSTYIYRMSLFNYKSNVYVQIANYNTYVYFFIRAGTYS